MGSQISGFCDIQQWISGNRAAGLGHEEIANHDAKQRGDTGESRQFTGISLLPNDAPGASVARCLSPIFSKSTILPRNPVQTASSMPEYPSR
jgi:hypothetical protein